MWLHGFTSFFSRVGVGVELVNRRLEAAKLDWFDVARERQM